MASVTVYVISGSIPVVAGPKTFTVNLADPLHSNVPLSSGTGTIIPQYAPLLAVPGALLESASNSDLSQPAGTEIAPATKAPATNARRDPTATMDQVFSQDVLAKPKKLETDVIDQVFAALPTTQIL